MKYTITCGEEELYSTYETGLIFNKKPCAAFKYIGGMCFGEKDLRIVQRPLYVLMWLQLKKIDIFIFGKSQEPPCFKSIKKLTFEYLPNNKGWFISGIIQQYVFGTKD